MVSMYNLVKMISAEYQLPFEVIVDKYNLKQPSQGKNHRMACSAQLQDLDDDYVEMEELIYQGKPYLIDSNQKVYRMDRKSHIVTLVGCWDATKQTLIGF